MHTAGGTALVPAQAASVVVQYQRATKVVWRERQQKKRKKLVIIIELSYDISTLYYVTYMNVISYTKSLL